MARGLLVGEEACPEVYGARPLERARAFLAAKRIAVHDLCPFMAWTDAGLSHRVHGFFRRRVGRGDFLRLWRRGRAVACAFTGAAISLGTMTAAGPRVAPPAPPRDEDSGERHGREDRA